YILTDTEPPTPLEEAYQQAIRSITEVFAEAVLEQDPDQAEAEAAAKLLVSMAGRPSVMSQIRSLYIRGNYLFKHSVNVAFLSVTLGKWLKLPDDELIDLGTAALLHDIGMASIPDYILDSPRALTSEERELLAIHPQKGAALLTSFSPLIQAAIVQHHERMDGSGYPTGISDAQICNFARIISIADVYESLTSERVYRAKKTPYEAIVIIRSLCFNQLDPTSGVHFCNMLLNSFVGDQVLLDNGKTGEVIWVDTTDPTHLLIRTRDEVIIDTRQPASPQVKEVLTAIQSTLYE
ncbi:MAG: HD-GYP domain-containing protein, partial [Methylocystaceae bacterium]